MRCRACDVILTSFEATRKFKEGGGFVDLCNDCYRSVEKDIQALERHDLMNIEDVNDTPPNSYE